MPSVCITADDYGLHGTVNQAIEHLAAGGCISGAAVMVHGGAVLDTVDRLHRSGVAVGLHLVFTQEVPASPALMGTPLAPRGTLPASPYALARVLVRRPRLRSLLRAELMAQIQRYHELGLPLDFINSHEHVHEIPALWSLVAEIVDERTPAAIRSAHAQPITPSGQGALALLSKASWRLRPPKWPGTILSPLGAGQAGRMGLREIEALVERGLRWHRSDQVVPELVVHPAVDDAPLRARYGSATGERRAEYELLGSGRLRHLWRRRGVEITTPRR